MHRFSTICYCILQGWYGPPCKFLEKLLELLSSTWFQGTSQKINWLRYVRYRRIFLCDWHDCGIWRFSTKKAYKFWWIKFSEFSRKKKERTYELGHTKSYVDQFMADCDIQIHILANFRRLDETGRFCLQDGTNFLRLRLLGRGEKHAFMSMYINFDKHLLITH